MASFVLAPKEKIRTQVGNERHHATIKSHDSGIAIYLMLMDLSSLPFNSISATRKRWKRAQIPTS